MEIKDARALLYPITIKTPAEIEVCEGDEVVLIEDTHTSGHQIFGFDTDLLIDLLHLIVLWLRLEVGEHDTVHDEHTIIGEVSEVTPIGQIAQSFGRVVVQRLVYPVPDSTTADVV